MINSENMKHFISATLSGISNQSSSAVLNVAPATLSTQIIEPVRTDFSNLFGPACSIPSASTVGTALNASALAIAAAKAKDLLRSKNFKEVFVAEKNGGNSATSNGNDSSQEGERNIRSFGISIEALSTTSFRSFSISSSPRE